MDPLIAATIALAAAYAIAAYLRERDSSRYSGVWRWLGDRAPISPLFVAFCLVLALPFVSIVASTPLATWDPVLALGFVVSLGLATAASIAERRGRLPSRYARVVLALVALMTLALAALAVPTLRYSLAGVLFGVLPLVLGLALLVAVRAGGSRP
jgi:hypothetical protein